MGERLTARIVPTRPITVAILEEDGKLVAYGILANVSEGGACLWTDGFLRVGMHLRLQISCAEPSEIQEANALVVWGQVCRTHTRETRKYGLEWQGTPLVARERLNRLAGRPVPPTGDVPDPSDVPSA